VAASFEKDFAVSKEITLAQWKSRPLWSRIKQRLWGWVDRLVVNALNRRG